MKGAERWALGAVAAAAAAFTVGVLWRTSWEGLGQPSYDIYGFFYPNQVYAWRSLLAGRGLLWNPYQDCGAPFFAMSQVGLLYPVNVVFALLDREPALLASALINLTITGAGTVLLGRRLGLAPAPALCAALAFQLGWVATWLTSWSPIHIASLAWLPVALWRTEALVERPALRPAILLAAVLALAHLPGFYQTGFYIYQLIALRIAWACLVQRAPRPLRLIGLALAALAAALAVDAVQLLPSIELTRASLRGLQLDEHDVGGGFSWPRLLATLSAQYAFSGNAIVVLLALASLIPAGGDAAPARRRDSVAFYWVVAVLYFVLSLGPGSLLYDVYERLPFGAAFRGAWRLGWVANFAVAMLAGFGAETVLHGSRAARRLSLAAILLAALAVHLLTAGGLRLADAAIVLGVAAAGLAAASAPARQAAAWLVPALVACSCLLVARSPLPLFGLRQGDIYAPHAATFAALRQRMTAQDRVFLVGGFPDFALMPKSASLFHLPSIFDYDTLASRTYVDFFTYMRTGHRLRNLQEWYWITDRLLLPTLQRPLFDLTAARYLVSDRRHDRVEQTLGAGVAVVEESDTLRIYENGRALGRARYVPRVQVAGDDEALAQLAAGAVDPRQVALVERAPGSGFHGSDGGSGEATIAADEAERVVVRVRAAQPGFLYLADLYFPGWVAEVNGSEREILRANTTFRAVEVPAGDSEVVFTYRPLSLRLGALISGLSLVALILLWRRSGRTPGPVRA